VWNHIGPTGDYSWHANKRVATGGFRFLRRLRQQNQRSRRQLPRLALRASESGLACCIGGVLHFGERIQPCARCIAVGQDLYSSMASRLRRRSCADISAGRSRVSIAMAARSKRRWTAYESSARRATAEIGSRPHYDYPLLIALISWERGWRSAHTSRMRVLFATLVVTGYGRAARAQLVPRYRGGRAVCGIRG
jgi:hypothetical protein